ncbi:epithelial cell-transforming sequence 2 oncogene-like [Leuresthes tenuis]|uniref:epithelial cell-transforming sequence 2 oncogene-like n=1 Tax=Leuresthes tenuis TaxID=355514 RepID=UPI003B50030A
MEESLGSTPHSVKRWQLNGTDYEPQRVPNLRSEALFSSWTPLHNKRSNLQLFEERVSLVLHWFSLWNDTQRKHLLHSLLTRSTKSQLKYCRDLLIETVPVTRVDFTAVLPRFLSLYVMSFLSPLDLCRAAQVSWHWRVLAEQDCLWAGRCIRRGWFLPYAAGERQFGAWKNHYVTCVSTLDLLTPREATAIYGTLNQQSMCLTEEEEERRMEKSIRKKVRDRLQEQKRLSLRSRGAWGSNAKLNATKSGSSHAGRPGSGITFSSWPSLSWPPRMIGSPSLSLSLDRGQPTSAAQNPERVHMIFPSSERLPKARGSLSSFTCRSSLPHTVSPCHFTSPSLLILVSKKIPAYELVLSGLKASVIVVLFDYRGTLSALLTQVERATSRQPVQRVGLLAPGGTEEIHLFHGSSLSERTVLSPDHREFWEKLCGWVAPLEEGGGIDIFCPLAASASGVALIRTLSTLTGLEVRAPVGLATGSFQNILGEWSDGDVCNRLFEQQLAAPALQYVCDSVLQSWCRQAQWMEEALGELRSSLEPQLQLASLQARGRALGYFLWEKTCLDELCVSKELSEALTEGLTALTRQEDENRPLEFLSAFLTRWSKNQERQESNEEDTWRNAADDDSSSAQQISSPMSELPQTALDWRGHVARELYQSECLYLGRLSAVMKVYHEPLTAALNSNRAILSYADIQIVFSPVTQILQLNRMFQADLLSRLQQWGAEQCVGDVFAKLCLKLRVYTNYLNNYTTALRTIDKCRETKPAFRAFLKIADRTLATHMLSLQELLLCPVWRIQEYVTLLQVMSLHTQPDHPDHTHLCCALNTMLQFRQFIQKLKHCSEPDRLIEKTQRKIQGCPSLREGNRQLITTQDAVLLRSPDEQIPDSLKTYEQVCDVGLFLFNDALVLTRKNVQHTPFMPSHRSTYTFLASVALTSLTVREIMHTQYVRHAFVLEGPCRSWVCSTERGEEIAGFLSVLREAMNSALKGHR